MIEPKVLKIGMREFREHLPQYLLSPSPVAITKHGETVGFYIPTRHRPEQADMEALKEAAIQLDNLLISYGLSVEDLVADFRALRTTRKRET